MKYELDHLKDAERIVREAAEIAREHFGSARIVREKQMHDIVTEADLDVERYIVDALMKLYPDYGFYAEEEGKYREDSEHVWILDPIDGTKYYSRNVPLYAISLALERRGELILGIVYSPENDQMFSASLGQGAKLNGVPVRCSGVTQLQDAIVCVEIPSSDSDGDELRWALDRLQLLIPRVRRMRILGISALSLSYCAIGGFDAYLNLGSASQYYDFAAGLVIAKESGAEVWSGDGKKIAGPRQLVEQLSDLIQVVG